MSIWSRTALGDAIDTLVTALAEHGYEPRIEDGEVILANCPFHALARDFTQLICGMNLSLCNGVASAAGLSEAGMSPQLRPEEGCCCVRFVAVG